MLKLSKCGAKGHCLLTPYATKRYNASKFDPPQMVDSVVRCIMLTDRQQLGLKGEAIAAAWLEQRGWRILNRRFRHGHRDLDLVASGYDAASGESVIAFIEVRTRHSSVFGRPTETVQWKKQREIRRSARAWLISNKCPIKTYRFDLLGITLDGDSPEIDYIPNAF